MVYVPFIVSNNDIKVIGAMVVMVKAFYSELKKVQKLEISFRVSAWAVSSAFMPTDVHMVQLLFSKSPGCQNLYQGQRFLTLQGQNLSNDKEHHFRVIADRKFIH